MPRFNDMQRPFEAGHSVWYEASKPFRRCFRAEEAAMRWDVCKDESIVLPYPVADSGPVCSRCVALSCRGFSIDGSKRGRRFYGG